MTHQELTEAITGAMKAREEVRLSVLRGLSAAATNELVAEGKKPTDEISDDDLMTVISRAAKQRKDSIEQFIKGGRLELAEKERAELKIIEEMLPAQMSREEVEKAVKNKSVELGVSDKSGANKLMGALMKELRGRADGTMVREVVFEVLP